MPHEAPGDEGKYTPRRRREVIPATEIQKASHVRAPSSSYRLPQRRCAYGSGLRRSSSSLDFAANTTRVPQRHTLVVPAPLRQQCALRRPSQGHTADATQNGRHRGALEPVSNIPQLCELLSVYKSLEGETPDDPLGTKPPSTW